MIRSFPAAVLLAFTGVMLASAASAQLPNYRYAEISYGDGDLDIEGISIDQDGLEIEGSYRLDDSKLWFFGSYTDLSGDLYGIDVDVESLNLGVGAVFDSDTDGTFDVSLQHRDDELTVLGESVDINGLGVAAGGRWMMSDTIEIFGRLGYLLGDYDGVLNWDLGVVFDLAESFSVSVSYEILDGDVEVDNGKSPVEVNLLQIGARVRF